MTERSDPSERSVKCSVSVHPAAVVCNDIKVMGLAGIQIGEGTIIHPACTLHAKAGPIVIGRFNVIEEQVHIMNTREDPLVIGDYNLFEVGAKVCDGRVGNANLFECKAQVNGANVGDGCTIGVAVVLPDDTELPDETVIVGPDHLRHVESGAREEHVKAVAKQIEVLKDMLPRSHDLRKS